MATCTTTHKYRARRYYAGADYPDDDPAVTFRPHFFKKAEKKASKKKASKKKDD